jgi:hypothetical protein
MAKSEKSIVASRVHDVLRLIVAGAEFPDIWRYAQEHRWTISQRQVRRYMARAHRLFAKSTRRDRQQLLGRHLAQRKSLYARAVKTGDLKTALLALKDEATLQGLYTPTSLEEQAKFQRLRNILAPGETPPLSRRVRVARLVMAQANQDSTAQKLVEQATPRLIYTLPDTAMPEQMLHIMALMHVSQQLDYAGMVNNALYMLTRDDHGFDLCTTVFITYSYLFKVGREGWDLFCQQIGIDGQFLVAENYKGQYLEMVGANIEAIAATADQVAEVLSGKQNRAEPLKTAKDVAAGWREMFEGVVKEE